MRHRILIGMLLALTPTLWLGACATADKARPAAWNFPECRKARMLCDESRGSVGFFAACAEASRHCRAARDAADTANGTVP